MTLQEFFDWIWPRRTDASKVLSMSEKVAALEQQADDAETAARLRERAIKARQRINNAKKVAPVRGPMFWVWMGVALILLIVAVRSCF